MKEQHAKGGGVGENDRMYNFLTDDLEKLEKAIKEGNKEEVDKFFSYWGYHLKSLKTESNDRMYNFLTDDLKKLENAVSNGDNEEVDRFFSYWNQHLKSLKMTKGGGVNSVDSELEKWVALDKVGKFKNSAEKSWYEGTLDKLMDKYELSDEEGTLGTDLASILEKQKSGTSKKVSKKASIKKTEAKQPDTLGGWSKDIITTKRRRLAIASRDKSLKMKERYLSAARALKALANVTKDAKTKKIASNDAKYFFGKAK
jgi:hypothetical protein